MACVRRNTECRFEAEPKETHSQAIKRKYELIQGERSAFQELWELLQTRPENEALSIFRRLREGDTPEAVMQTVRHGDLLLQLSLTSEGSSGSESVSNNHVSLSSTEAENAYFDTGSHRASSSSAPSSWISPEDRVAPGKGPVSSTTSPYYQQDFACEVVEPLIEEVQPSQWTTVTADDEMMRSLLTVFFQLQYRWFSIFHKDYFLQDMATGKHEHCSSLLVNTVLACACVSPSDPMVRPCYSIANRGPSVLASSPREKEPAPILEPESKPGLRVLC